MLREEELEIENNTSVELVFTQEELVKFQLHASC